MPASCRFAVGVLLGLHTSTSAWAQPAPEAPISPGHQVIQLFNGKDLSGFTTWLKDTGRADPRKVYTVENGMIHISGEGMGYLATEKAYRNYHLLLEYQWGKYTTNSKVARNSGLLLHAIGPDGGARGGFMTCLECQIAQGCEGDLIVIRGADERGKAIPATVTCETEVGPDGKMRWKRGGTKTVYSGKQFWWSMHEPFFRELLDTRGRDDVASPLGQWTKIECLCDGGRVTIKINGVTVNECFDAYPSAGKILLENEGSEIYFRNIELRPLPNQAANATIIKDTP